MTSDFKSTQTIIHDFDVLVIGGGSAGQMAAFHAQKNGQRAGLVDKGGIYRSGCGAAGNDHFLSVLETGPEWDTPEVFLNWYHRITQGLVNVRLAQRSFITHNKALIDQLERLGLPMRLGENNSFIRTKSFQQPGPYFINGDGRNLKPKLCKEIEESGVTFVKRICITDLLVKDGRCVGAVGFAIRTGDWHIFRSKVTVLATGNATRMYQTPSGLPFNTWHSPYNTGAAQAMAFRAGASVVNMEFVNYTLTPRDFSASGLNAIVGMGGYIVNALGERFLFNYHEKGEQGPRWVMPWGVYWETVNGRGPCYFDVRHLAKDDIDHLQDHLLPVDKNTFGDWLEQMNIDISQDLFEAQICEGQHPAFLGAVSGVNIDDRFLTNLPGLMATGASAPAIGSIIGAMCTGIAAGLDAAEYAAGADLPPDLSEQDTLAMKERALAPLKVQGMPHQQFEDRLRHIMSAYVGIGRTESGLKTALDELHKLARCAETLTAGNGHELLRCAEALQLYEVAKMIVRGALERKESRFGLSHYRGDFPESREEYHLSIAQTLVDDNVTINTIPAYSWPPQNSK
jgi:adenylylsulfate reductase, subunit A